MRIGLGQCVVGSIDTNTGDTIASCGTDAGGTPVVSTTPAVAICPTNTPVTGSCTCPAGTSLDPTSLMCTSGLGLGNINSIAIVGGVVFGIIILAVAFMGGKKR